MLITGHKRQIVQACHPVDRDEAIDLWHNITPVKFGDRLTWANAPGTFQTLASYTVPEDGAYLLILKTECYTFTDVAAAPGFRNFEPSPTGSARWSTSPAGLTTVVTPITQTVPIHLLTEASEFLMVKAGLTAFLEANLSAPPDANTRFIRTIVYSYLVSAIIADRIGSSECLTLGANT